MRQNPHPTSENIMATLLLTATAPVSQALAPKLERLGHQVIIHPLLKITPLAFTPPTPLPEAILITSRYALPAARAHLNLPLYVVGEHTAKLAKSQGHEIAHIAKTAKAIEPHLPANTHYLRGRDISYEFSLPSSICYAAELQSWPSEMPAHDATLLLSARVAAQIPSNYKKPLFCMSERIYNALPSSVQAQAHYPTEPTEQALLERIKDWHPNQ